MQSGGEFREVDVAAVPIQHQPAMRRAFENLRNSSATASVIDTQWGFHSGMLVATRLYRSFLETEDTVLADGGEGIVETPNDKRRVALGNFVDTWIQLCSAPL